jgi:tetratricopeptide (TPR) repeat protein
MRDISIWSTQSTAAPLIQRRDVNTLLFLSRVALPLLAALFLALADSTAPRAAESAVTSTPDDAATTGDTDAYLARLRAALPQSWLQREFQRQRSFPAFAHSRQMVAKGQYEEAFEELEKYLASDPDDLVIQFGYLILATDLKRYRAAIDAADRILASVPDFAPALFYRGLARAALGENKEALPDLAAAVDSKALAPADTQYARRSLAMAAVASPATADALALLEREEAQGGADGTLLVAKGQLLEHLDRNREAAVAYDDAARSTSNDEEKRAAWVFGAELALKSGDPTSALSRAEAAWKLAPGNPEVATVLAEAASKLGRTDLVEAAERATRAGSAMDRGIRESLANALFRVGRFDQAAANFDELAETASSPAEEYRLRRAAGFAAQAAKDVSRALSELQRAAAINSAPEALVSAAEAALQAGYLDVAAGYLSRLADASGGKDRNQALQRLSAVEEQNGHFQEALAALDRIPADQRDASVERRSVFLASKVGNLNIAVAHAERVAVLEPTRANLRALGEAQLAAGQPDAAIATFQRALDLQPEKDPALREMLANSLVAVGRPSLAATEFETLAAAAKLPADKYRLQLAAGFAALKAGDSPRALTAFRQAVAIEANSKSLEAAAETAFQAGHIAEAAGYLERLTAADDDIAATVRHLDRLSFVYEKAGDSREALEALARLPKAAQSQPEIMRREAALAQKLGDRKGMLAHMRDLAAVEPSENNLAALADAQIGAGQSGAAAITLESLLAIRSLSAEKRADYLERLGNIEASRGNPKRAQSLFAEAYHLSPSHPPEWLAQAAESAVQAKDWEEAIQSYRMLAENERIPRKTRAAYDARLGSALASLARDQEALTAYDAAIQLGGATPSLHEDRGIVLMRLGRAAAAVAEFRAAYDAHPRADLALSLGYAHQAAHQPGLAIVFLRRALADSQALSPAQRQQASAALGYAYSDTEQHEQAAGCFEKALGILPSSTSTRSCGVGNETAAVQ